MCSFHAALLWVALLGYTCYRLLASYSYNTTYNIFDIKLYGAYIKWGRWKTCRKGSCRVKYKSLIRKKTDGFHTAVLLYQKDFQLTRLEMVHAHLLFIKATELLKLALSLTDIETHYLHTTTINKNGEFNNTECDPTWSKQVSIKRTGMLTLQ